MSTRGSLSILIGDLVLLNAPCFPSKEMQAWPPLAVEGKFASQGNLKIRCQPLLDFLG
ncbi:unnamed protein product [Prunus armeniaca]